MNDDTMQADRTAHKIPRMTADDLPKSGRVLQVSLEGLDMTDDQIGRIEQTMKSAVLTEIARMDLLGGIAVQPLGKGIKVGDHIINGLILRNLLKMLDQRGIGR